MRIIGAKRAQDRLRVLAQQRLNALLQTRLIEGEREGSPAANRVISVRQKPMSNGTFSDTVGATGSNGFCGSETPSTTGEKP